MVSCPPSPLEEDVLDSHKLTMSEHSICADFAKGK